MKTKPITDTMKRWADRLMFGPEQEGRTPADLLRRSDSDPPYFLGLLVGTTPKPPKKIIQEAVFFSIVRSEPIRSRLGSGTCSESRLKQSPKYKRKVVRNRSGAG